MLVSSSFFLDKSVKKYNTYTWLNSKIKIICIDNHKVNLTLKDELYDTFIKQCYSV